mgnify:CR=1 FL=1
MLGVSIRMEVIKRGDSEQHIYYVKGDDRIPQIKGKDGKLEDRPLPSCSSISRFADSSGADGLMGWAVKLYRQTGNPQEFKQAGKQAQQIGIAFHESIHEYISTGEQPVDASPLYGAWYSNMMENGVHLDSAEYMVYHPDLLYAGTLDAIGTVDGVPTLFDWKTTDEYRYPTDKNGNPVLNKTGKPKQEKKTFRSPTYAAQIGGYSLAYRKMRGLLPGGYQAYIVYTFKDTGNVLWEKVNIPQAELAFETCAHLYGATRKKAGEEGGLYV